MDDYYEKWLKTPEGSQLKEFVTNNLDAVEPEDLLYFDPQTTPHLNASELTGHARRKLEQLQVRSRVKVSAKNMRKWLLTFTRVLCRRGGVTPQRIPMTMPCMKWGE